MTDKQIIIDGVDVSGCIFHSLTIMSYAGYNYCKCFECACECHNDCYYKQLKRKEQECEWLKKANDGILTTIRILAKNNIKLREVLTEIKEIASYLFNMPTSQCMAKLEQILQKNK